MGEQRDQAVLRQVARLEHWGRDNWTRRVHDEYIRAFAHCTPRLLEQAVDQAIRERATRPQINQLAEIYAEVQAVDDRRRRDQVVTEGVGCPKCREEYPVDKHAQWIGTPESQLVSCLEHRVSWRGVLPPVGDDAPLPADVWRTLACRGDYGRVVQAYALSGGGPATLAGTVTEQLAERS